MAAGYQNLLIEQGTSFSTIISLDDVTGASYNLFNYSASSQIRKSYYSANVSGSFSVTIPNPLSGQIIVQLGSQESANIFPGRYVYDIKLISNTDAENNTIRILEGIVEISPQVTR
jgi:hypothetical protein